MKKLLSILLCLCLALSLGLLPALAAEEAETEVPMIGETEEPLSEGAAEAPEEPAPVPDGGIQENVCYYSFIPGSEEDPTLLDTEVVAVGGHPGSIPTWSGMSFTWYLAADLSGDPVDPASFTVADGDDVLSFYGFLDTVCVRLHAQNGGVTQEVFLNPGDTFDTARQAEYSTGDWPAGWADADGNLFNTENTPIRQDIDLYALPGSIRITYVYEDQWLASEGLFDPGTPKHAPTAYIRYYYDEDLGMTGQPYSIIGWEDESGRAVDISTVTVAASRTFYAVLDHSPEVEKAETDPDYDWGFDWSLDTFTHTLTLGGAEVLTPVAAGPDGIWTTPWAKDAASIENVVVEEGVKELDAGFFYGLTELKTIELPYSIERVAHDIFLASDKLDSIAVADGYCECIGWLDEDGFVFSGERILNGEKYSGDLYSAWIYTWTEGRFTDVGSTAWYHDAVQFCYQTGLMNGVAGSLFSPGGTATRGQVVTVLWRLAGEPYLEDESWYGAFSDVPSDAWYSDAVAWAAAFGITTGYTDGAFRPGTPVTRQEFLTFLYRYTESWLGEQPPACDRDTLREFADYADVASWSEQAECWSVNAGLQNGSENKDGTYSLNPRQSIKRSEMAAFLTRYCDTLSIIHLV